MLIDLGNLMALKDKAYGNTIIPSEVYIARTNSQGFSLEENGHGTGPLTYLGFFFKVCYQVYSQVIR